MESLSITIWALLLKNKLNKHCSLHLVLNSSHVQGFTPTLLFAPVGKGTKLLADLGEVKEHKKLKMDRQY